MARGIRLEHGDIVVRLANVRDAKVLKQLILENRSWLRPWEATHPHAPNNFDVKGQLRLLRGYYKEGLCIPFVIEYRNEVVGQLNVSSIIHGSLSSGVLGYWIAPNVAGLGITPTAVALVCDYLFERVGLHRIEIDIRPENISSLRVVQKLGFRYEGLKERFIHINGAWRDHYVFALTSEEVGVGLTKRWMSGAIVEAKYPFSTKTVKHTARDNREMGS